jgi:four helix bundle protein
MECEVISSYRELIVWQRAMDLVDLVYRVAGNFPREHLYGLGTQLQKCAVSVPSNIAEGHARDSTREYLRFISIALGSVAELETQVLICQRQGLLPDADVASLMQLADEVGKMLRGVQQRLRTKLD